MENAGTVIKKYIFPIIITFTGLMLLYTALFSGTGKISQSGNFTVGALVVFLMGIVTFLYIKQIINKNSHLIVLGVMLITCLILGYSTYSSVATTITEIELKKEIDTHIKQGLRDIEVAQLEYKKKYGWYSNTFSELKRFLLKDSVYSISTTGIVPDYKITPEHALILGYDLIQDYIQIESYDESEALKCGLLKKDTSWINVMEKLFPTKIDSTSKRIFPFNVDNLNIVPMSEDKEFILKAGILESSDDISFESLQFKKGSNIEFVSANIIDFNGNDQAYYGKNIVGLIIKDTIHQLKGLKVNDIISEVNGEVYNNSLDLLKFIKDSPKDTLSFEILRSNKKINIRLTQKDIIEKSSRAAWSDLSDLFEYNLSPSFYNPLEFSSFYISKDLVEREDEFSSPKLNIGQFKILLYERNFDTSKISFEFNKSISSSYTEADDKEDDFFLLSKLGTPVFTAFDPSPYDPLNERDTLITGSMTEVKTSGNWK